MATTAPAYYERETFLEPRRSLTLGAARRRSQAVRALRVGLAAGMVGILAGIASEVARHSADAIASGDTGQVGDSEVVRMINPRFNGRDTAGSPYIIIADAAVRRIEEPDRSELEHPALTFDDPDNPSTFVSADRGIFHREDGALDLQGNVRFESSAGYSFSTDSARVYLREGRVVGEAAVEGQGPVGAIRAQSFEIVNGGESVHFRGEVSGRINQEPRLAPPLDDAGFDATLDEDAPPGEGDGADPADGTAEEPADDGAVELRRENAADDGIGGAASNDAEEEARDEDG